jgi:hypothetical protein
MSLREFCMTFSAILLLVGLWLPIFGQGYPPRTTEDLFSTLRDAARFGRFPSDDQLLELGFRKSTDAGVEINSERGRLYVLISGNNRNIFSMTWSPKEPLRVIPELVLSALISKSAEIELIGRERMQVTLHEPADGPAVFREGLVVGVVDGKLYSTVIEAMAR